MSDLLQKHAGLAERHKQMLAAGADAVGVRMDEILSPTRAIINGAETILAGTNNYMGLTFDPACIKAGIEAMEKFGTGTTGSRIANGSYALHQTLEAELADYLQRKHVIIFSTGYQANLGMLAGLAGPDDTIFLDADSHASIYDGCRLSGARLVRFRHNNAADLEKRLARMGNDGGGRLVVLEGIYSMYGDRAPLADFVDIKRRHNFSLMVDEAHSLGVLGEGGRGLADEAGLEDDVDFVVGTFSKSLGAVGGYGAGNQDLFNAIRYAARAYMFSASSSPSAIATVTEAVRQLKARPELRDAIRRNSRQLFEGFTGLGLELCCNEVSPVIAVRVPDEQTAVGLWNGLLKAGVYVNLAIPPGTPNASCLLRCSVSAAHSPEEISRIIEIFGDVCGTIAGAKAVEKV